MIAGLVHVTVVGALCAAGIAWLLWKMYREDRR